MKQYWQLDYFRDGHCTTRFFYGTESAVQRRARRYQCDHKDLRLISKSRVEFLRTEKQKIIISL